MHYPFLICYEMALIYAPTVHDIFNMLLQKCCYDIFGIFEWKERTSSFSLYDNQKCLGCKMEDNLPVQIHHH